MNLKKIGKVFTSKFVGTGPSSYKKRIYRAAVSQRLRNTALQYTSYSKSEICKWVPAWGENWRDRAPRSFCLAMKFGFISVDL